MARSGRRAVLVGLGVAAAAAAAAWWQPWRPGPADPPDDPPIPVRADSLEPYRPYTYQVNTDQAIRMFEERVRGDPNHLNLAHLGGHYIRKAKETGDHTAYARAEDAFRRALKDLPDHRESRIGLSIALCGRHRLQDLARDRRDERDDHDREDEACRKHADAQWRAAEKRKALE